MNDTLWKRMVGNIEMTVILIDNHQSTPETWEVSPETRTYPFHSPILQEKKSLESDDSLKRTTIGSKTVPRLVTGKVGKHVK